MKSCCRLFSLLCLVAITAPSLAQTIDGRRDTYYCSPIAIQNTQTQFGDSTTGKVDIAGGSELDNVTAWISGGVLYLHVGGNLESNFNKLEIFFDTRAGGQNRVRGDNFFGAVNRMGDDGSGNGLKFDAAFEADFWLSVTGGGDPYSMYVDYCELRINDDEPGDGYYVGQGFAADKTNGGELTGGNNPNNILCTIDNSNILGVVGGTGSGDQAAAEAVETGVELAIPLAQLGNPEGDIKLSIFVNGGGHDFASNQFLGGLGGGGNFGEPRNIDLSAVSGDQYFVALAGLDPCGACCVDGECFVVSSGACPGDYLGDGVTCFGNPCSEVETGACCVGETCSVVTAAECASLSGDYLGDNTVCDGAPCERGACCLGTSCNFVREEVCAELGGVYEGDGSDCNADPCKRGACCLATGLCVVLNPASCTNQGGDYQGDDSTCEGDPCGSPSGPATDGTAEDAYGDALAIQDTETGFGDSNTGDISRANGSELDQAFAFVANGRLHLALTGNLESNGNDLELFIDSVEGGQSKLRGDNPDVDFNGLNRMGDNGSGNGLEFDEGFAADYYLTIQNSGTPRYIYVNYAKLRTDSDDGVGRYLGRGTAGSDGGLNFGNNPDGVLVTLNNSNTAGVPGGLGFCFNCGEGVLTGVEISIPLSAIGNPAGNIKITAVINGQQHDFLSQQALAGGLWILGGYPGEPRNFSFNDNNGNAFGPQFFEVPNSNPCAGIARGDSDGSGGVDFNDIDCFVAALIGLDSWADCGTSLSGEDAYVCANDTDGSGGVDFNDIDSFIQCIIDGGCE